MTHPEKSFKSRHLSPIVGSLFLFFLFGHLGRYPGRPAQHGQTFPGWRGSWGKIWVNNKRDDTQGEEALGLSFCDVGKAAWCILGDHSLLTLYRKMGHPITSKSFPGRLSVLPGNTVLVFNMLNYSGKWAERHRNDLWHILGSDLRARKTAYVFILS